MRISVLGSGSGGNAALVSSNDTTVMVDAGFGPRALAGRCAAAGVAPNAIAGIFITHEHSDHRFGAVEFAETWGIPIFCSRGTADALGLDGSLFAQYVPVAAGREGRVGDVGFRAFATPHDANESLAFRFEDARASCAIATDLGHGSDALVDFLRGVNALLFEFNHDEDLLRDGPYHWLLKRRIAGGYGHLSNRQSAEIVGRAAGEALREVVALHLSRQNNDPAIVTALLGEALERAGSPARFGCAEQARGYETIEV
ncbi:MAG TPA: MBL fold metallo-hydrolase [Thermoanaerobaculia bacterium]|nr:MBL fold metallo-hydrolase [Thermoanaerobaculia bacterium]